MDARYLDVDQVHLLPDALHGSLCAQSGDVGADESVRLARNRLGIHIIVQLHVTGVDTEDFQTTCAVFTNEEKNVNFSTKTKRDENDHKCGPIHE